MELSKLKHSSIRKGVSADGWIRCDVPSRELQKDKDYKS
jgi:hypothetical protein